MSYTLINHLDYNLWADTKLAAIIAQSDESIVNQETASSFPTISKTILHIIDAEYIWLRRLQGESLTYWPSQDFGGGREELLKSYVAQAQTLKDYVIAQGNDYLSKTIEYKNMKGDIFSNTVEEILYHVINHGTFHRGQLVTMLRANGFTELSSTDLISYLRV